MPHHALTRTARTSVIKGRSMVAAMLPCLSIRVTSKPQGQPQARHPQRHSKSTDKILSYRNERVRQSTPLLTMLSGQIGNAILCFRTASLDTVHQANSF